MTKRQPCLLRLYAAGLTLLAGACSQTAPHVEALSAAPDSTTLLAAPRVELATPAPLKVLGRGSKTARFGREWAAADAHAVADWVVDTKDSAGLPFIVVDKTNARVYVFGADGRLRGASPALLGSARGDDSVPGIGERKIADIQPEERTTPAGRFAAEMGRNIHGEDILWVDYDAAVSMHRVRATNPTEQRLQRLATPTPNDNRISYGCINLPAAFYDRVVKPAFAPRDGIVYVLPETRPAEALFGIERKLLAHK